MNKLVLTAAALFLAVNAQAATESSAATALVVAPTEGSTISAPAAEVAPAPKKITVNYTSETTAGSSAANKGNWDGALASVQHVGLKYDLGDDKAFQFRQYFYYNGTDGRVNAKTKKAETD